MKKILTAEIILNILNTRQFNRWFESDFIYFMEGADDAPSKETILKDIESLFNL